MNVDSTSRPQAIIQAMDMLIRRGQETQDFSEEELGKIRKVRDLCVKDVDLIQEARVILAEQKSRLARKEQSLSVFMEKLTPEDLQSAVINKMLEYFMAGHIELDSCIAKIERTLDSMYPSWTSDQPLGKPKNKANSTSRARPAEKWLSVDNQLDNALNVMESGHESGGTGTQTSEDDMPPPMECEDQDDFEVTQSSLDLDNSDPVV
jgi:hypothetical protein